MPKSLTQRFILAFVSSKIAESMEAHSRSWMVRCKCGHSRSIWDLGGIRWKAAGKPRIYGRCPQCNTRSWHTLARDLPTTPATPATPAEPTNPYRPD